MLGNKGFCAHNSLMSKYVQTFDGEDFIYRSGENVIVHYEDVEVVDNLYAENIPLFTCGYSPKLGDTVVDIGAGNGYEIQYFSKSVGPTGRVIAIEADPSCFRRLSKLVQLANLKNVECVNVAASDKHTNMFLTQNHIGGISNFLTQETVSGSLAIVTQPTGEILKRSRIDRISLLKVNVEGHELQALEGMRDYLSKCDNLVVSCHDFLAIAEFQTRKDVVDLLLAHGFLLTSISNPINDWERDYIFGSNSKIPNSHYSQLIDAKYQLITANVEKHEHLRVISQLKQDINSLQIELNSSLLARELRNLAKGVLRRIFLLNNFIRIISLTTFRRLKPIVRSHSYRYNRLNETYYVGTTKESGLAQLEILKQAGLKPSHKLIEFGAGALNGSLNIFEYLNAAHYVGVDPNSWLRNLRTAKSFRVIRSRFLKKPRFLANDTFQGPAGEFDFDFVFSHSVLSNTCRSQLSTFFYNSSALLKSGGVVVSSWRDVEPNAYGSLGSPNGEESMEDAWLYPGVTYFSKKTVRELAINNGFQIEFRPDLTEFLTKIRPGEYHDWFVARKIAQ